MICSVATVFPELYTPFLNTGIIKKAIQKNALSFDIHSFFEYAEQKERIDAPTFGHGPGMLIKPEIIEKFMTSQEKKHGRSVRIFFSPHGTILDQKLMRDITEKVKKNENNHIILVAARYEGIDARAEEEYADVVVSLGQFVLMGGDIPALALLEGITRLMPNVLGNVTSHEQDSFSGPFTDYPEFTQPVIWHDRSVPEVIRSGNHEAMESWRKTQAIERTVHNHFSWIRHQPLTPEEKKMVLEKIPAHYVALLHNDIIVDLDGRVGNTSITSTDIHDIARSSKTFGTKHYFLISDLYDQQKIAQTLLDFWHDGFGVAYNHGRHEALKQTSVIDTLDNAMQNIEDIEGKKPLLVATSARTTEWQQKIISYNDQTLLWKSKRPILLLFGTGKGIANNVLERVDYILEAVNGLSEFNHLSVRSAVAIILDRLLGLHGQ